jgi:hypothetical protein
MRSLVLAIVAIVVGSFGCVDDPVGPDPPSPRVIASWDPLACSAPHRVRVELDAEQEIAVAESAPCSLGEVVLDVPGFATYRVRAGDGDDPSAMRELGELVVDQPVVAWEVPP